MKWRVVPLFVAVLLSTVSCSASTTAEPGLAPNFFGELAYLVDSSGDFVPDRAVRRAGFPDNSDPDSARIGPATLVLADGRRLEVPAGTSGGNWCRRSVEPEDAAAIEAGESTFEEVVASRRYQPKPCLVIGQVEEGVVQWFIEERINGGTANPGRWIDVGTIVRLDGSTATLGTGFAFEVADDLKLDGCIGDPYSSLAELLDDRRGLNRARASALTLEINVVFCTYAG